MRKKILITITVLLFASCSRDETPETPEPVVAERTLIVYMAAENNLWTDAYDDIEEMRQGFSETGVSLIVFLDTPYESPCILKITSDSAETVRTYGEFNSANPERMRSTLNDIV
ncbi:MAG: hypothetical protein LBK97_08210, partial [Prevotellaceae bacterium]|nr:hypothetical protein [Prevotellaceae bacterium]